jgi:hypothetical protein
MAMNTTPVQVTQLKPMTKEQLLKRQIKRMRAQEIALTQTGEGFRASCTARVIGEYRRALEVEQAKSRKRSA